MSKKVYCVKADRGSRVGYFYASSSSDAKDRAKRRWNKQYPVKDDWGKKIEHKIDSVNEVAGDALKRIGSDII